MKQAARSTLLATFIGVATLIPVGAGPSAQTARPAIIGSVYDAESGRALADARIVAYQRTTATDSLGRWTLNAMPPGPIRIRVLCIGFQAFDTTLVLPAVGEVRLDVRLHPGPIASATREAAAANVAGGRIDSSALGLLHRSGDSALTFGEFGARFLHAIAAQRGRDSNTVLSPASAAFALSMPLLGASGATADEITRMLGVNGIDGPTLRQRTARAMIAGTGRSDVQLETANAIWVDTCVHLKPAFVDAVASYRASVRTEALAAQKTVSVINAWADSVTHGRINQILNERLPDTTRLFIANAVYFKGKWLDQFDKAATRPRDFRVAPGNVIRVHGMERTGPIGFRRADRYQMIRLPYRGGRFAMYVVLPDSGVDAGAIEQEFAAHRMPVSLVQRDFREVHVVLPRLHVEQSHDLRPALKSLGMRRAFDCDEADFQGISDVEPLCIAKATQFVYLSVDEEGTEAAAITGLSMVTLTALGPPPTQFIVDRPFLLLLRDEQTGADLFVSTIRHP